MIKCSSCKKSTMISIKCRCSSFFCMKCKLPEKHNCDFDYRKEGKKNITKNNPKIINEKIKKI